MLEKQFTGVAGGCLVLAVPLALAEGPTGPWRPAVVTLVLTAAAFLLAAQVVQVGRLAGWTGGRQPRRRG